MQAPPANPAPNQVIQAGPVTVTTVDPNVVVFRPGAQSPEAIYKGFEAQRQELANQLENLEDKRRGLTNSLQDPGLNGATKSGLELRLAEIDKRITAVDAQLAAADAAVAKAASVPGAIVQRPPPRRDGPPEEVWVLGGMFIVVVCLPVSLAYARRVWKRSASAIIAFPQELADRLNRLDQAIDSVAVEVERIGEGQRFVTRVMSESGRALGGGATVPIDGGRSEKSRVAREGERGGR